MTNVRMKKLWRVIFDQIIVQGSYGEVYLHWPIIIGLRKPSSVATERPIIRIQNNTLIETHRIDKRLNFEPVVQYKQIKRAKKISRT